MANDTSNDHEEITAQSNLTDIGGQALTSTRLTRASDTRTVAVLHVSTVIPVIFIPGIMGTNLQNDKGKTVWEPPNTDGLGPILNALGQMGKYLSTNSTERQEALNPTTTKVYYGGSVDAEGSIEDKVANDRGWGALSRSSYQPMMSRLQKELNEIMLLGKMISPWDGTGMRSPADYGEQKGQTALAEDQLKYAANYRFDVWGGGYNWTKSNLDSSLELIDYIEKTVLAFYDKKDSDGNKLLNAEKVILVTHSMGGLVARAICNIHGYSKVLGVVHGVMPATGAAATYHHARCGYEGVASVILGRNAAEVIAVMGNSPGALELIPSLEYNCGKPWLKLGGMTDESPQLPKADPYEEIYKSRAWYGLVPAKSEDLLDPAKLHSGGNTSTNSSLSLDEEISVTNVFDKKIDRVKDFHASISQKYPTPAYVHYGADSSVHTWTTVHWKGDVLADYAALQMVKDNHNGKLSLGSNDDPIPLHFGKATQAGDGTVPDVSGAAPGDAGVNAIFRQGNQGVGAYVNANTSGKAKGYDHQDSYNDIRSQWATLHSIVKIAQDAQWHK
jgi:hypothetical protein